MASIQERTTAKGERRYRVQVRLKGRPQQTASFRRLTDAKRWAQTVEADLRRGQFFPDSESRRRTLDELIERYKAESLPRLSANEQRNRGMQLAGTVNLSRYRPEVGTIRFTLRPRSTPAARFRMLDSLDCDRSQI